MMVNLDNSIATSVGLGLEDLLHVNNNNNEISAKEYTATDNPCNNSNHNNQQDQQEKSIINIIEKVRSNGLSHFRDFVFVRVRELCCLEYQKYSRLRCLLRVKDLVICFYLGWSGSIVKL